MVNIDFFKDLMEVLKDIVGRCKSQLGISHHDPKDVAPTINYFLLNRERREVIKLVALELRCILTAFELLTGQGEK